jgi:hypothetical protein
MIKLRTKINVTHADVTKTVTGGSKSGVVSMMIFDAACISFIDGARVPFRYFDSEKNEIPDAYNGVFKVPIEQLKAVSSSINSLLPKDTNLIDRIWNEIKIIAIQQMSTSFNILATQIEEYE